MKKDDIEERRRVVWRFMTMRMSSHIIAQLLGVSQATVHADMKLLKERMIEEAACASEAALTAHEEVAALLQLAGDLSAEVQLTQCAKDKARLAQAAAHCFFLAGRLKQGRDP